MTNDLSSLYDIVLSPLHEEIEEFVADVLATEEEAMVLEDLTTVIDECVVQMLGQKAKMKRFGSCAMGLSTHASDLDLVILNVVRVGKDGFQIKQKARAVKILYSLARKIARSESVELSYMRVVARARIPVLKIGTSQGNRIDVTLNDGRGVKAARKMRATLNTFPSSVAVILVLKCMLKQAGLSDVSMGGLGGYALTSMVIAHCRELRRLGRPDLDYGDLLLGFLERFGYKFDYIHQAVSARRGEVLHKPILEKETLEWIRGTDAWEGRTNGKRRLFIEDPLTGMNLTVGTHSFPAIQKLFQEAYKRLRRDTGGGVGSDRLSRILDIGDAVCRNGSMKSPWTSKTKRSGPGVVDRERTRQDAKQFKHKLNQSRQRSGTKRVRPRGTTSSVKASTSVLSTLSAIVN